MVGLRMDGYHSALTDGGPAHRFKGRPNTSALISETTVDPGFRLGERRVQRASPRWWRWYTLALAAIDELAFLLGVVAAERLRFGRLGALGPVPHRFSYFTLAVIMAPAWLITLTLCGSYERRHLETGSEEYRRVFGAALKFVALVATLAFVFKLDVARGFVAIAIPLATLSALAGRYVARRWLHRRRGRRRLCMKGVLVVGSEPSVSSLVRQLRSAPFTGLAVVGACTHSGRGSLDVDGEQVPVVAGPDAIIDGVVRSGADAIAIADPATVSTPALAALAWQLEGTGIGLLVAPSVTDVAGPRIVIRPATSLPLVHVEEPELSGVRRVLKSVFDRVFAAVMLVLLSPILVAIGLAVRCTSEGPALFRQARIGLGGKRFVLLKFRTMVADAESRLDEVAHLNEHDGVLFKMAADPRVTPFGRFLRRWSLDELPQLWNVVRGDMSMVGPRPPLPAEVERYSERVRRRLLVKPGLTGLWQVNGRAALPWDEAVRLDLYYLENWSPSLDAVILAKTIIAIVRRRGAY